MSNTTTHEKAILILQRSHDGNDLFTSDLWLVENAVNNKLSLAGWEAFDQLYRRFKEKRLSFEEASEMLKG